MKTKKILATVGLSLALITAGAAATGTAYAFTHTSVSAGGGIWVYGYNDPWYTQGYSNYYQQSLWHTSTVINNWTGNSSYSGSQHPTAWANASIGIFPWQDCSFYWNN